MNHNIIKRKKKEVERYKKKTPKKRGKNGGSKIEKDSWTSEDYHLE